jgi:hypothetical protein
MLQRVLLRPAAIAAVHFSVLCMDADEIVEHGVEAHHPVVRLNLLAEAVGESGESAHPHAEVQVLPLNV